MSIRKYNALFAGAILISLAAAAPAPKKPDFSGTWKLALDKSDFGALPAPEAEVTVVEHREPSLKVKTVTNGVGGDSYDIDLTTDGKESTRSVGDTEVTSVAKWDGAALVIETRMNIEGNQVTIRQRWTLSADGKTLTNLRTLAGEDGSVTQRFVSEKQ